jgi:transcriptional regulator with XRE-family HTH domain
VVTPRANALGDYLRARREQLCPQDCGLVAGARRRVAGLRREEVATLAGISCAYYLRLEQGRDSHPSPQVLDALARALQLDINATDYLYRLAGMTGGRQPESAVETVADYLDRLIDQFSMRRSWPVDTRMCWPPIRLPAHCRRGSHPERTFYGGAFWRRPRVTSTLIGTRRRRPQ